MSALGGFRALPAPCSLPANAIPLPVTLGESGSEWHSSLKCGVFAGEGKKDRKEANHPVSLPRAESVAQDAAGRGDRLPAHLWGLFGRAGGLGPSSRSPGEAGPGAKAVLPDTTFPVTRTGPRIPG